VGIDRESLPGVDIVYDINRGIPLERNCAEFVMASHVLQYVDDWLATMREIYRICKHKAIVCVVVPYAHVSSHCANPHYKHLFTEHSPRFLTRCPEVAVPVGRLLQSEDEPWGLAQTDDIDFRLVRIEFFYFPEYMFDDEEERSYARQTKLNVVKQMMFHLVAVKEPLEPGELELIAAGPLEEPAHIAACREADKKLLQKLIDDANRTALADECGEDGLQEDDSVAHDVVLRVEDDGNGEQPMPGRPPGRPRQGRRARRGRRGLAKKKRFARWGKPPKRKTTRIRR
jgi:SAM-dependent methyltransferase